MNDKEIKFKELSYPLKIAIILAWIVGGLYCITFVCGLILSLSFGG